MKHRRDQSKRLVRRNANVLFLLLLLHLPSCSICLVKHHWSDLTRPLVENLTGCIEHYAVPNLTAFITTIDAAGKSGAKRHFFFNRVNNLMRICCCHVGYITLT